MSDVEAAAPMVARVGHLTVRLELPDNDVVRQRRESGLQALQRLSDDLRVALHVCRRADEQEVAARETAVAEEAAALSLAQ